MATTASAPTHMRALAAWPGLLSLVFLLLAFVAGRLLDEGSIRLAVLVAAGVLAIAGLVGRALPLAGADAGSRALGWRAILAQTAMLVGGVLALGLVAVEGSLGGALMAVGLLLATGGAAVVVVLELVAAQMRSTGVVEMPRVRAASNAAITVVAAIGALAGLFYGVNKLELRWDFAFVAPTAPSGATLAMVDTAGCGEGKDKPEVFLFFERGSTALVEVQDYFDALAQQGVRLRTLDQAFDPELATAMKVTKNGTVGFRCGERTESWNVGVDRDEAQKKLAKMDEEVRTRLAKVSRDAIMVYFTVGHGERSVEESDKSGRGTAKGLKKLIEAMNGKSKKLGVADGLTREVPADASLVVVLGPQSAFLPEETAALVAYAERGGSLALFLDPPQPQHVAVVESLQPVLQLLTVQVGNAEVANDKEYVKKSKTSADHVFVFSSSFGNHKAVRTLSQARGKAALLFLSAASVDKLGGDDKGRPKVSMVARSRPATWIDVNANRSFDEGAEKRAILDLAGVIEWAPTEGKETRALVVGDSDVVSDLLLGNEANQVFVFEALQWLLRDDQAPPGAVRVDEDVPIRHTSDEDVVWFYGTTFGAPLFVVSFGLLILRLSHRRRGVPARGGAA